PLLRFTPKLQFQIRADLESCQTNRHAPPLLRRRIPEQPRRDARRCRSSPRPGPARATRPALRIERRHQSLARPHRDCLPRRSRFLATRRIARVPSHRGNHAASFGRKIRFFRMGPRKATELGVSRIVPLAAARSEKALLTAAAKRAERWKKLLLEASQQSRRV